MNEKINANIKDINDLKDEIEKTFGIFEQIKRNFVKID